SIDEDDIQQLRLAALMTIKRKSTVELTNSPEKTKDEKRHISIDEDDTQQLRLAALMTFKRKSTVELNNSPKKKRPRIIFEHNNNNLLINQEDGFNYHKNEKNKKTIIESKTLEVFRDDDEKYIEEDEDEEDEGIQERQQIYDKKVTIQHNDLVDLRTELKRRKALRLNTIQVEVKKKPKSFYPARLLQSAIRDVVKSSSSNEVKRNKHSKIPEIVIKTEGNLDGRRVFVMNRNSKTRRDLSILHPKCQEVYDSEGESYTNVKVSMYLRTVVNSSNTIQKGFKKIKKPILWP
ncbi:uncharacterized protein LOC112682436, partial [Sipha flava]|uniref:Uncharacterized protein LOC112682436 n=1 Tax=Sipha flava TaxID=143950 RepID=A0A8B8FD67_9HEMI